MFRLRRAVLPQPMRLCVCHRVVAERVFTGEPRWLQSQDQDQRSKASGHITAVKLRFITDPPRRFVRPEQGKS
jgi:hypothetical protein